VARAVEWQWIGGGKGKGIGSRVAVEWRWIGGGKGEGVGGRVVARARALAVEWRSSGGGGRVAVVGGIGLGCSRYQNSLPFDASVNQARPAEWVLSM
jgi:hypothetical protein